MSVTAVPIRPLAKGSILKLWLGLALLALIAAGVAWFGTSGAQAVVTQSGVRVQTLTAGAGPKPTSTDIVLIDYEGRLTDGTVFDSSKGKQPLPLPVTGSIPGFEEALKQMQKGGSYRIFIPAAQAYGATPPPGAPIPPNADLEFDVTLIDMVPQSALQGMGPPGGAGAPPHPGGM